MSTLVLVFSIILMIVGLLGTIVPMIPGIPLIYLGYFLYGLKTGWLHYGAQTMVVWGLIAALSLFVDYYAGAKGAQKFGATRAGIWGSILGTLLGIVFLGFIGVLVGPFMGAIIGELLTGKNSRQAFKAGWGTFLGFLAGSLFKIILALTMFSVFLWQVIMN